MRAEDLKKLLDRRPFQPMRIHISSGESVDVRHPEMVMLSRSIIFVAIKLVRGLLHDFAWYNLIHVVKVEPLRQARRAGHRRQRRA